MVNLTPFFLPGGSPVQLSVCLSPIQWHEEGLLKLEYVGTNENVADVFTKVDKNFINFKNKLLKSRGSIEEN